MRGIKGLTLTSALLATLLAFSGSALAQEASEPAPDSGVNSGIEGHDTYPQKAEEQAESAGIQTGDNSAMQDKGSELAPGSGVDATEDRPGSTAHESDATSYSNQEIVKDKGTHNKD
ncbi:hypothetical protein [Modicisalibacter tunisiensis]|uniref:YbgS-like protein n=1 Tax=Modicisalibacter tunisiensis TaxID=390637 RepID=A0ABS7X175_9GAMM|nr:hypothetical protein [Modicisalibacter tunisiensis]KXS38619.1 MAG: hypothetical protein AWU55_1210 [Halomonadaceae bacterium T82-2]MBZ9567861.1 hypothetical protein [Modicisalibacter tunisiensis]